MNTTAFEERLKVRWGRSVCDNAGDFCPWAYFHCAAREELGVVGKQDDVARAGDHHLFGFGDQRIGVTDAIQGEATGADEGFVSDNLTESVLCGRAEHNLGGAVQSAAEDKNFCLAVIGEVIGNIQGIGDHGDALWGKVGCHAAGGRTAVEDDGFAIADELGGGASDAIFFGGEDVAALVKGGREGGEGFEAREAAADAAGEALGGEGIEVTADGGSAGAKAARLFFD